MTHLTRRRFLAASAAGLAGAAAAVSLPLASFAQEKGERPAPPPEGVSVINPQGRVPVSLIIDDSTCLVNLNRFAVPQFAEAWRGRQGPDFTKYNWRDWPHEIPDSFVRKFAEWCHDNGVKGKYSVVPYPACVGRIDRVLPGWTQSELEQSIALVRDLITPDWDIHPEMVTHTWVIDTKTGHPFPERSPKFQENWEWSVNRSADELSDYLSYALTILKNVGLPADGVTTPGGFGNRSMPQLAAATLQSVRSVFGPQPGLIPHFFRNLYDKGDESVAPRVLLASDLDTDDPRCVVSVIGCTGDWTGGWDNSTPVGANAFITQDLQQGRMVDVISRGQPACMVCHWTGIHFNGQELGFKIFQEVVSRLRNRYGNHLKWMKLSEISRYWAARELTTLQWSDARSGLKFQAPFACPGFTFRVPLSATPAPEGLKEVTNAEQLRPGTYIKDPKSLTCCIDLPRGKSQLRLFKSEGTR